MSNPSSCAPVKILLVDNNPGDVRLTGEALQEGKVCHHLRAAVSGEEALSMLRGRGERGAVELPDIILLDLNLPDRSGLEILAEIKGDDELKKIPVVMLATSGDERDIQTACDLHASCHIVKPVDPEKFIRVVKSLENFWVSIVRLPDK